MRGLYEYGANKSNSYHVYKGPGKCLNGEKFALSRLPLTRKFRMAKSAPRFRVNEL